MAGATVLGRARDAVDVELRGRSVPPGDVDAVLAAAVSMLDSPRSEWAQPANAWEDLVVSVALALLRISGHSHGGRAVAIEAVRTVLQRGSK